MGLGCRNVAFIAVVVLLSFEVFSNFAVGNTRDTYESNSFEDHALPIHRRNRRSATVTHTETINSYNLDRSRSNSYQKFKAETWDQSSIDGVATNGRDTFYTYTSPVGTRVKIEWKDFNVEDNEYEYITGYSGGLDKSKIKSSEEALADIKNDKMFLFSTKPASEATNLGNFMKGKSFKADENKLTLHFHHGTHYGPHTGKFEATVRYEDAVQYRQDSTNKAGSMNKRSGQSGGGGGPTHNLQNGESFYICDQEKGTENQILENNDGYITSHKGFADKTKMSQEQRHCKKILKSASNENIQLIISELNLADQPHNKNECDPMYSHIKITDLTNGQEKKICYHDMTDEPLNLMFGNKIEIDFSTGTWATAGFTLRYLAAEIDGKIPNGSSVKPEDQKPENTSSESDDDKVTDPKGVSENPEDNSKIDIGKVLPSVDLPEDFDPESIDVETYDETLGNNSNQETATPKANASITPNKRRFSEVLVKVTMVAVGLILIVILISAGFIACHKTKEQDHLIRHLTQKLDDYENNKIESTPIISSPETSDDSNEFDRSNGNNNGKFALHMTRTQDHQIIPTTTTKNGQTYQNLNNNETMNMKVNLPDINIELAEEDENKNFNNNNNNIRRNKLNTNYDNDSCAVQIEIDLKDEIMPVNNENKCYNGDSSSSQ